MRGGTGSDTMHGGQGNDTVAGGDDDDSVFGNTGDDVVRGGAGDDLVYGNQGADRVFGGSGNDQMWGDFRPGSDADSAASEDPAATGWHDRMFGGAGADSMFGGQGDDQLSGGDDADELTGGSGNDLLRGGAGNDLLIGGSGEDRLFGGSGDDTLQAGINTDFSHGGDGNDTADFSDIPVSVIVDLEGLDPGIGDPSKEVFYEVPGVATIFEDLVSIENVTGSNSDDEILGDGGDNILKGNGGDDHLEGRAGNDQIFGGSGNDTMIWRDGDGADLLDGGVDDNTAAASAADIATGDTLDLSGLDPNGVTSVFVDLDIDTAGVFTPPGNVSSEDGILRVTDANGVVTEITLSDVENIIGSDANETLFGNNESNTILGGGGDDRIHPFASVLPALGDDHVDGGAGNDTLLLNGSPVCQTIDLATGTAGDTSPGSGGPLVNVTFANIENAEGATFAGDRMFGDSGDNILKGNGGDDHLEGRAGNDQIFGGSGNDTMIWRDGDGADLLDGGVDDDTAAASAADIATGDTLDLSGLDPNGVTSVFVDLDVNTAGVFTPPGNVSSEDGILRVTDANGVVTEVTLSDVENIIGSDANETLFGNNESNTILGGGGDDRIHPFASVLPALGGDHVDGGAGNDTLLLNGSPVGQTIDLATGTAGDTSPGSGGPLVNVTFANIENAEGATFAGDRMFGDGGDNILKGNGGDDLLEGRGGNDALFGGTGDDLFVFDQGFGNDAVDDFVGAPLAGMTTLITPPSASQPVTSVSRNRVSIP